jgi:hypothetical protein
MSTLMRYAATALLSYAAASAQEHPREMFSAMRPERPRTFVPPPATAAARAAAQLPSYLGE